MAIPGLAVAIKGSMDPADIVDFQIDCADPLGPLLESGETIASFTLTLGAEATALGLTLIATTGYTPSLVNGNQSVYFWLSVAGGFQSDPAFDAGARLSLVLTITTNHSPARVRQRTVTVQVIQQ